MTLTAQQKSTVKAAILADPVLAAKPNNSDGNFEIAAALNAVATPDFYVWKSSIDINEVMQNGFDWTRVDNLTAGKARIWEWIVQTGTVHPNQANVRAGVLATFGVAGDLATRLAVFGHFQRLATRVEKLLATGTGTTTSEQGVGPATTGYESPITADEIESARLS